MYKILIIEDNVQLAETIRDYFTKSKYSFEIEGDGLEGLAKARDKRFDLILLDVVLPKRDGFYIAKSLRQEKIDTPILMMTEKDQVEDIEVGFSHGVDAYLPKPFNLRELKARLEALLQRPPRKRNDILHHQGVRLDPGIRKVTRDGKTITLRKKEFEILRFLLEKKGNVITREQLLNNLWSIYSEPFASTIDVHISNLRRKLNKGGKSNLVKTVHGVGFIITN